MKRVIYATHPESTCVIGFGSREEFESAAEKEPLLNEVTREEALKAAAAFGDMMPLICGRCYADDLEETFPANCTEKPEALLGYSLGQYHCPDCGAMVVAGIKHPELCKLCFDRKHPGFDRAKAD